jgi:hypothetical protein
MRPNLKRLIAPALVVGAMVVSMAAMPEPQRRAKAGRRAKNEQTTTARATGGETGAKQRKGRRAIEQQAVSSKTRVRGIKVVRRVGQVTLNYSTINRLLSTAPLASAVAIQGNTINARPGYSIWELSNGAFWIIEWAPRPGDSNPTYSGLTTWRRKNADGSISWSVCHCPDVKPEEDTCTHEHPDALTPGKCIGPECCMETQGIIEADGTGTVGTPPSR